MFAKTRKLDNPYAVYRSADGTWEYRVLKTYKHPESEAKDAYARWFVAGKSPNTFGSFEYGDMYATEISRFFILVSCEQAWFDHYSRHARGYGVHIQKEAV
jgi:hypothetical protein